MKVELIDVMGSDLTVVNAARVSFKKNKEVNLKEKDLYESQLDFSYLTSPSIIDNPAID